MQTLAAGSELPQGSMEQSIRHTAKPGNASASRTASGHTMKLDPVQSFTELLAGCWKPANMSVLHYLIWRRQSLLEVCTSPVRMCCSLLEDAICATVCIELM